MTRIIRAWNLKTNLELEYDMNLPTIQQNTTLQQAVDAKDLHQALGLHPAKWSEWSKNNITNNPFALEGKDYEVYNPELNTQGGRPTTNYLLSIEFAKKLAMQVRTEIGEQIRNYFLECERRAQQPVIALPDFTNPVEAARAFADQYEAKQIAQEQLAIAQPKAAALDFISSAVNSLNARDTAKTLGIQPQKFNKWCITHNWMYRDGKDKLQMCSNRLQQGYMEQRPVTYTVPVNRNGAMFYETRATTQPLFTAKGLTRLASIFSIVHEVA